MGISEEDIITLPNGMVLSNAYSSFAYNAVTITEMSGKYMISGRYTTWINEEARLNGKDPVRVEPVTAELDSKPTGNIYELLYNKYKSQYSGVKNFSDKI